MKQKDGVSDKVFRPGSDGRLRFFPWLSFGPGYLVPSDIPREGLVKGYRRVVKVVPLLAIFTTAIVHWFFEILITDLWLNVIVGTCVTLLACIV